MSSDPPFLSMDQTGIGQQTAATTLDCGSSPERQEGLPLSLFHHHSSGLCFVVSYALITSDWETIPFSSWEKAYPSIRKTKSSSWHQWKPLYSEFWVPLSNLGAHAPLPLWKPKTLIFNIWKDKVGWLRAPRVDTMNFARTRLGRALQVPSVLCPTPLILLPLYCSGWRSQVGPDICQVDECSTVMCR